LKSGETPVTDPIPAPCGAFTFLPPEWADETPSTNDALRERLSSSAPPPSGTVFAARRQTKGKGRLGNVWRSAESGDLTFSFIWKSGMALRDAGTLSLACGLAVRDFLAELGIAAECKWPNDVFVGDAKICGILFEGGSNFGSLALVAGIGVNLRAQPGRDAELGRPTASIEQCLGRIEKPETLLPSLLRCLERRITAWQAGGFAAIRDDMESALWGRGKPVAARTPSGRVEGIVAGLGEGGELLVLTPGGRTVKVGSVTSLDGIYSGNPSGNAV
jgi:BirA family biotin operon repressor/biotin-[acetyl-CoA-carboxylase] ligase